MGPNDEGGQSYRQRPQWSDSLHPASARNGKVSPQGVPDVCSADYLVPADPHCLKLSPLPVEPDGTGVTLIRPPPVGELDRGAGRRLGVRGRDRRRRPPPASNGCAPQWPSGTGSTP